jgi:hypothetical protein
MARIKAYSNNYINPGATVTVATGPGGIHTIIATCNNATPQLLAFYDNTSASVTLMALYISSATPILFNLKDIGPIRFTTGLTVVCPAGVTCFVVTEE